MTDDAPAIAEDDYVDALSEGATYRMILFAALEQLHAQHVLIGALQRRIDLDKQHFRSLLGFGTDSQDKDSPPDAPESLRHFMGPVADDDYAP